MTQRKPNNRSMPGPRPGQAKRMPKSPSAHYPYYPRWRDWWWDDWYDYGPYDYDPYDYEPYGGWEYSQPEAPVKKPNMTASAPGAQYDPCQDAYQKGFKDGWQAAMEYIMIGWEPMPPETPIITKPGAAPEATPTEGAEE